MQTYITSIRLAWRGDVAPPDAEAIGLALAAMIVDTLAEAGDPIRPICASAETAEHSPSWTVATHVRA